ncbi:MAG: transglutaminase-like domain-containing protein, partial [Planctomycetota bacterium]
IVLSPSASPDDRAHPESRAHAFSSTENSKRSNRRHRTDSATLIEDASRKSFLGIRLESLRFSNQTSYVFLVGTGILTATSLVATGAAEVVPVIQKKLQDRLNETFDDVTQRSLLSGTGYVRGSFLGSLRRHILDAPEALAIRCYSESPPGYLRGSTFHQYANRQWSEDASGSATRNRSQNFSEDSPSRIVLPSEVGSTKLIGGASRRLNRFQIEPGSPGAVARSAVVGATSSPVTKTVEIHNQPEKGMVVFTALNTAWAEAVSNRMRVTIDGGIAGGFDLTEPYVIGVSSEPVPQPLSKTRQASLLTVPTNLQDETQAIVDEVITTEQSARERADAISKYFQSEFSYSLEPYGRTDPPNPIEVFLQEKHPAHCEFFATAATMTLRQAGIPTRYVTGYVTDELDSQEESYLARNRDAHAWVEAYDDESKIWFPVEATPGRRYSSLDFDAVTNDDSLTDADDDLLGDLGNEGWAAWLGRQISNSVWVRWIGTVLQSVLLPLFVILLVGMWWRSRRLNQANDDPIEKQSRRFLAEVDRVARRHQLVRRESETLHQFARRIDAAIVTSEDVTPATLEPPAPKHATPSSHASLLASMADWYREFASSRYQGQQTTAWQPPVAG